MWIYIVNIAMIDQQNIVLGNDCIILNLLSRGGKKKDGQTSSV